MARSRSVLTVLIAGAFAGALGTTGWTQENPPQSSPPPPQPGAAAAGGPGGPDKPSGERRGWGPGGAKGEGRGPGGPWGDKRGPRENLTPEQMKERALRDLEKLTPEQRNEVWRATWAVLNLPTEERQKLIGQEDERRQKVKEEIDRMLKNTGIQVPDDQRRKFFHRYFSARRTIEEQVKKEGEERRQVLMTELEGKLKQEFGSAKTEQTQLEPQK
jgi:hypothetical protein